MYIDLDCYKLGLSKDAVLYFLEKDFFNIKIPNPNLIIDSGQGMYLIWTIEIAPHKALSLWAAIQKYFHLQLKDFGADSLALDPTRILRVVGSTNSKSNSMVHIIKKYEYIYIPFVKFKKNISQYYNQVKIKTVIKVQIYLKKQTPL